MNCLTHRDASIAEDKWLVFLDWCQCEALDFCLLAETGICSTTPLPFSKKWVFDFLPAPKALPGFGVGLLYNSRFQGRCSRVSVSCLSHRFAAWLVYVPYLSELILGTSYFQNHFGHFISKKWLVLLSKFRWSAFISPI